MNPKLWVRGMLPSRIERHIVVIWSYWKALTRLTRFQIEHLSGMSYPKHIDSIFTHMTAYEKQTLYRLARRLPEGSQVVEIGSYLGASACCLAAGIAGSNSKLHCVDTFTCDTMPGGRHDVYPEFMENTKPYADVIIVHRAFSKDVVGDFEQPIDLLFVDGDHSWQGITTDLKLYIPLMRDKGVLVMHDVRADGACQRALNQIVLPIEIQRLARLPNMYAGRIRPADVRFGEGWAS